MISAHTSQQLREMMRQVVVRGTAKAADVEGYEVGGKTGTADKPNAWGGYSRDKTISTFAAFFPAARRSTCWSSCSTSRRRSSTRPRSAPPA